MIDTEILSAVPSIGLVLRGRAVHLEGGLFGPDLLERLEAGTLPGQRPADFGIRGSRSVLDEVAEVYRDARDLWQVFRRRLERLPEGDPATSLTREGWLIPFLGLLGYELRYNPKSYERGGMRFGISHRAGEAEDAPPVHIVGFRRSLDRMDPGGRPRISPHALTQEFLNRSDHLWGIVTNGRVLRLLRQTSLLRRQAYVEFDLEAIFEAEGDAHFNDFVLLYRLLHRTRLPRGIADASDCWLERYYRDALEQGNRARDRLRAGVERCLELLGTGFLRANGGLPYQEDPASLFYADLLRLVYRFLFLLVAEERGLLRGTDLYREHYSISRLRRLVDRREAYTEQKDIWLSLKVLWHLLRCATPVQQAGNRPLASLLGIPVLDGGLFEPMPLEEQTITNRDLLEAFWHLVYYSDEEARALCRVNYADLDVEELGSVYESLLDNHPIIENGPSGRRFGFAAGTERKSTGSYYTPAELVSELVRSALEPVLEERLRSARTQEEKERAILSLRVLDPACGSGHFLLAAARRLGLELARVRTGEEEPSPEARREATREVIAHCIYGVDKNPLAVELCKVALWIESCTPGKPLTFLDHRIRCGDSLLGVRDLEALQKGIPDEAYDRQNAPRARVRSLKKRNREERRSQLTLDLHRTLEEDLLESATALEEMDRIPDDAPERVLEKSRRYTQLQQHLERERLACDLWTAAFFWDLTDSRDAPTTDAVRRAIKKPATLSENLIGQAQALAEQHRFFHWSLEFPEVFMDGGFDVVLGNPPFMGGLKISGTLGPEYRQWMRVAYKPFAGTADLCATFYRRAFDLLRPGGRMGMVATNTIGQGDTRESGLAVIVRQGGLITFARRFLKWPGAANVEVNLVAIAKSASHLPGHRVSMVAEPRPRYGSEHSAILDGQPVDFISSRLDPEPEAEPKRLFQNKGKAFQGDIVRGIGFVLEPEEAEALLVKDSRNADCLFPYLNGEDLNSHPEQKPSRWVICFHDWDLERARQYPDLLRIVEERVKPERIRLRGPGDKRNRGYWWQFGAYRMGMRQAIAPLRRVLVRTRHSELHLVAFVPNRYIYSDALAVFAFDDDYHFALLQSSVHEVWVWREASSLESRNRYTPTTCFDTFPFPLEEYRRMASGEWRIDDLPEPFRLAAQVGSEYHEHRRQIMLSRGIGLTQTYNFFHDPNCTDPDIVRLRELHAEMDHAILQCYRLGDLDLRHGFYENERGQARFTVSSEVRREILKRLLDLNHKIANSGDRGIV